MIDFKNIIVNTLGQAVEMEPEAIQQLIEIPPNEAMGDYAFPAFSLAKILKKNPALIAQDLAKLFEGNDHFDKVEVKGPYLNFFVNREALAESIFDEMRKSGEDFGRVTIGEGKTVLVEYSSPNIAKPFHIGHIRSTVIGDSIKRIYDFLGYDVHALNHLGDYGTQFGMMIEAYKLWGDHEVIEQNPIPELVKLYVRINQEAEDNPELLDESRAWFQKLESGDEEAVKLWKWFREVSLKEFERVYDMLGISFDSYRGESFYSDRMPAIVQELEDKHILVEDAGAKIVNLDDYKLPPAIIVKKDGSTIYITRDLAAAQFRKEEYNFYRNLYVVGSQQNLHFQQLFAILDKMGRDWAYDCVHIPFGMVSLEDGTLSTRRGKVLYLEDVLNRAIEQVDEILVEREKSQGRTMENREELAKEIGIGAVKFQELFNQRIKDYVFDWDKTLSFDGETGPYVQYTHARINSLLNRGGFDPEAEIDASLLTEEEEASILRHLYGFTETIIDAHEKYEPYFITRYIVELAQRFNKYYNSYQIIGEDAELTKARLYLAYSVKTVLKSGLSLLGIGAPDQM